MKAIRVHAFGGPEAMVLEDATSPAPPPGHVALRVRAAGVNFIDVYRRTGAYPGALPQTPGTEAAGEVIALGDAVEGLKKGDRVATVAAQGAYAEEALVRADQCVRVPDAVSFESAAAAMLQGMTAHYLVEDTFPLKAGDACLVHAAAGGVGLLLVQMAKARGARVIATAGTDEKAALASEHGADHSIVYTRDDFEAEVKRLTEGRGVDVVYDSVGAATFEKGLRCLRQRGLMALYGQSSGAVPPFDPQALNRHGSLFLTRPSLFHYVADRPALAARAEAVLGAVASGGLKLRIGGAFALARAAEAHRALESRSTTGKLLLLP
jgi:NADPH2:quinone reductase